MTTYAPQVIESFLLIILNLYNAKRNVDEKLTHFNILLELKQTKNQKNNDAVKSFLIEHFLLKEMFNFYKNYGYGHETRLL
jgi:hypothetical protein